jgi:F0F1-type ATP synthase membrane subunit b/b'
MYKKTLHQNVAYMITQMIMFVIIYGICNYMIT